MGGEAHFAHLPELLWLLQNSRDHSNLELKRSIVKTHAANFPELKIPNFAILSGVLLPLAAVMPRGR